MEKSKFNKQKLEAYCKSLGIFAVSYYTLLNNLIDSDKIAFIMLYKPILLVSEIIGNIVKEAKPKLFIFLLFIIYSS